MRRTVLSLLVLAVMLPAAAFARVAYLCAMDGAVRSACCCPAKSKPEPAPASTMAGACCTISTVAPVERTAVDPPRADVPQPELVAIAPPPPATPAVRREVTLVARTRPPDNPARSLFAAHCALLL